MDEFATKRAELRDAIIEAAFASGFHPDVVAGYILALEELGALEVGKPSWLVKSVLFRIEKGWRPNHCSFTRLQQFIGRRVDKWLAEPNTSPLADQQTFAEMFPENPDDAEIRWTPLQPPSPRTQDLAD